MGGRARDVLRRGPDGGRAVQGVDPLLFVYILRCSDGSFYTGAAKELGGRLMKHEAGTASRYTRARRPVELVWSRRVRTWGQALRDEHRIKQLKRSEKEALLNGERPVPPRGRATRSS